MHGDNFTADHLVWLGDMPVYTECRYVLCSVCAPLLLLLNLPRTFLMRKNERNPQLGSLDHFHRRPSTHTHITPPPARPHIARTHMPTGRHPHGPHSHPHSCTTQLHPYQHSCNTQKPTHTHIPPRSVDLLVCRLKRELPDTTAPAGTKMTSPPILVIGQTYRVIISRRSDGVVFPTDIGYVHSMGSPPGFD